MTEVSFITLKGIVWIKSRSNLKLHLRSTFICFQTNIDIDIGKIMIMCKVFNMVWPCLTSKWHFYCIKMVVITLMEIIKPRILIIRFSHYATFPCKDIKYELIFEILVYFIPALLRVVIPYIWALIRIEIYKFEGI